MKSGRQCFGDKCTMGPQRGEELSDVSISDFEVSELELSDMEIQDLDIVSLETSGCKLLNLRVSGVEIRYVKLYEVKASGVKIGSLSKSESDPRGTPKAKTGVTSPKHIPSISRYVKSIPTIRVNGKVQSNLDKYSRNSIPSTRVNGKEQSDIEEYSYMVDIHGRHNENSESTFGSVSDSELSCKSKDIGRNGESIRYVDDLSLRQLEGRYALNEYNTNKKGILVKKQNKRRPRKEASYRNMSKGDDFINTNGKKANFKEDIKNNVSFKTNINNKSKPGAIRNFLPYDTNARLYKSVNVPQQASPPVRSVKRIRPSLIRRASLYVETAFSKLSITRRASYFIPHSVGQYVPSGVLTQFLTMVISIFGRTILEVLSHHIHLPSRSYSLA